MEKVNKKHKIIFLILLSILFVPIAGTVVYSFSKNWGATILPHSLTLVWYKNLFADSRFLLALGRSFFASILTVIYGNIIIIPTILCIYYYYPKFLKYMEILTILPITVPGIAMAIGYLKIYSNGPLAIKGTVWILIGVYFMLIFPILYRGIKNNMEGINIRELVEAANVLGASEMTAFIKIIIPNLNKGLISTMLLSMSIMLGEFTFANFLTGGNYETIQIYLMSMKWKSGHFTSAIVVTFFAFLVIITFGVMKINTIMRKEKK